MGRYLHSGPGVWIPARIAVILGRHAGLDDFRVKYWGQDAELDAVLVDLAAAAMVWRQATTGTTAPPEPEFGPQWLSTAEAAEHLGMTVRGIVHAVRSGRLPAERAGRSWRIHREDLALFEGRRP